MTQNGDRDFDERELFIAEVVDDWSVTTVNLGGSTDSSGIGTAWVERFLWKKASVRFEQDRPTK